MGDYMASLDRLLAAPGTHLPARRMAARSAMRTPMCAALRAHRQMREAAILDGLRRGDRTIPEIVARVYQGLDPRLAGAAALSTLAHLEDLVARGAGRRRRPAHRSTRATGAADARRAGSG